MFKIVYILALVSTLLVAKDKVEIYASSVDSKEDIVKAYGEVSVVYKEYFLTAKEAIYNRESGQLELFGNVRANYENRYKILGKYAKLNILNKEKAFKPFYMVEKNSMLWISSSSASSTENSMHIDGGSLSGCNPNNPLWKLEFESSDYDTSTEWLDIYNARLYIYDIPVFYTPYFGYSLDNTRRSGVLMPTLGYSSDEGFFYEQPIYLAEQNWWDLELKPQIRTDRGAGLYTRLRFVDSDVSSGDLNLGYFKEKDDYSLKNNLAHSSHYGFDFNYKNSDFINKWFDRTLKGQSGLFVDIANMNDVDYINLSQDNSTQNITASQILSRVNLFYNDDKNYYGAYFKYYKNLELESNEDTLQKLPTLHYHSYLDTFFDNHIYYNLDIQSNNIYRKINKKVIQTDINLPVTLQTSLFDEYLNLSYTSYLYAQNSNFFGDEKVVSGLNYDSGTYLREHNIISASTQVTKKFEEFIHTIGFSIDYIFSGFENENGFYQYRDLENEFYNITDIVDVLKFNFSQYIFDSKGTQKIYHQLSQEYFYNKNGDDKYGELENELDYQITDELSIYSDIFYNYKQKDFSKIYTSLEYSSDSLDISLSNLYQNKFDVSLSDTNYLTSSVKYNYDDHYSYVAKYDYDLELNLRKNAEIGFLYKKRCWEFGLKYAQINRPVLEAAQSSSIEDRYIYFTIVFKPFMQSGSNPLFVHHLPQK